jgi:hypothetical protein
MQVKLDEIIRAIGDAKNEAFSGRIIDARQHPQFRAVAEPRAALVVSQVG